jgi:hypothetical protein
MGAHWPCTTSPWAASLDRRRFRRGVGHRSVAHPLRHPRKPPDVEQLCDDPDSEYCQRRHDADAKADHDGEQGQTDPRQADRTEVAPLFRLFVPCRKRFPHRLTSFGGNAIDRGADRVRYPSVDTCLIRGLSPAGLDVVGCCNRPANGGWQHHNTIGLTRDRKLYRLAPLDPCHHPFGPLRGLDVCCGRTVRRGPADRGRPMGHASYALRTCW